MTSFSLSLFGRVDEVPGVFHISTRFFHVCFVPLVPYSSYLVFRESFGRFEGVQISLSGRSVLVAWGKAFAVVTLVATIFAILVSWDEWRHGRRAIAPMFFGLALAMMSLAALLFLHEKRGIRYATRERAMDLARQAGVFSQVQPILQAYFNEQEQAATRAQSRAVGPPNGRPDSR